MTAPPTRFFISVLCDCPPTCAAVVAAEEIKGDEVRRAARLGDARKEAAGVVIVAIRDDYPLRVLRARWKNVVNVAGAHAGEVSDVLWQTDTAALAQHGRYNQMMVS